MRRPASAGHVTSHSNSHWYSTATEHHLTASVRAAGDPPFAQFQTDMCCTQPTQQRVDEMLGMCYLPEQQVHAQIDAVGPTNLTIICTHKEDVDAYNTAMLHRQFTADQIVPVHAKDFSTGLPHWQEWEDSAVSTNTLPQVAIGARVLITSNLNYRERCGQRCAGLCERHHHRARRARAQHPRTRT
jgi:hypothetical protein